MQRFDENRRHGRLHCGCRCAAMMSIDEEIRHLEEHKKFLQDQLGVIDKKIAALKAAGGS